MKKYKVSVVRISYAFMITEVEAENESDANQIAIDEAVDFVFSEYSAEYQIAYTEEI